MENPLNVMIPEQTWADGGSPFYRIFQPMVACATQEMLNVKAVKHTIDDESYGKLLWGTDIYFSSLFTAWIQGLLENDLVKLQGENMYNYNVQRAMNNRHPLNTVVDIDDWPFIIPSFISSYMTYGEKELKSVFNNGEEQRSFEWRTGVTEITKHGHKYIFNPEQNKKMNKKFKDMLRGAAAVTISTGYLANKAKEYNKNIYVLPNGVDFKAFEPKENESGITRIGYMYSGSHIMDWLDMKPHLRKIINERLDVKLVLMGTKPPLDGFDMDKVEFHPFKTLLDGFNQAFSDLKLDIGLCPLFDCEFNKCKSPLKWIQYAAIGAVTLAPNILYGDYIKDKETGFIYHNYDEFKNKLRYLIKRKETRRKVADNALTYTKANYSIDVIAEKYAEIFAEIKAKGVKRYEKNLVSIAN